MLNEESFQRLVRKEFDFLGKDFGFTEEKEERLTERSHAFVISYANKTTRVLVEGVNWGDGAMVYLGPNRAKPDNRFSMVPLWSIEKNMEDVPKSVTIGDQAQQIRSSAEFIKVYSKSVLVGDFTMLEEPRVFLMDRMGEHKRGR